jgi:hypothetical protein
MITDCEFFFDEIGNAGRSPKLGAISMCHGTLEEQAYKTVMLFVGQFGGTARGGFGSQASVSSGPAGIAPSHYAAGMAVEAASDFIEGEAGIQQFHSLAAAMFEQLGSTKWSHVDTPVEDIHILLHSLCRSQ